MGHCWENTKFFCSVLPHFLYKGGRKCFRKVCKGNIGHKLVNAVKTRSFIDVFFPVFGIYFGIKSLFMKHKMKKLTRSGLKSLEGLMAVFRKFLKPLRDVSKYGVFFWFVFSRICTEYGNIRTRKNSVFRHFSYNEPCMFYWYCWPKASWKTCGWKQIFWANDLKCKTLDAISKFWVISLYQQFHVTFNVMVS